MILSFYLDTIDCILLGTLDFYQTFGELLRQRVSELVVHILEIAHQ